MAKKTWMCAEIRWKGKSEENVRKNKFNRKNRPQFMENPLKECSK